MRETAELRIGDVARGAGVSVRSLRYYEEQGLLRPERTAGGQRVFDGDAIERVGLLQQFYAAGLTSTTIASLLPCLDAPSERRTAESVVVLEREHARLSAQVHDLTATRDRLGLLLDAVRACQDQASEH